MTMRGLRTGAFAVVSILLAWGAQAQVNPFKGDGPKMQAADLALMEAAATPLLQGSDFVAGTRNSWKNPASGWSGTVTAISPSQRDGLPCRDLDYDIIAPGDQGGQPLHITWCKTKDGAWKFL